MVQAEKIQQSWNLLVFALRTNATSALAFATASSGKLKSSPSWNPLYLNFSIINAFFSVQNFSEFLDEESSLGERPENPHFDIFKLLRSLIMSSHV